MASFFREKVGLHVGLMHGFMTGLFFVAASIGIIYVFEHKPLKLFLIEALSIKKCMTEFHLKRCSERVVIAYQSSLHCLFYRRTIRKVFALFNNISSIRRLRS
ncbi:MAG: DUF1761 domain-containing protein [Candidatus Anammoxibacter sp.]